MTNEHEPHDVETAAYGPSALNAGLGIPVFEYSGGMYVSPCDRGTSLTDYPSQNGIEQILLDGYYYIEIRVWEKNKEPVKAASLDEMRKILNTPNV